METLIGYSCKFSSVILLVALVLQCAALKYDPSKTYTYSYTTDVLLNDANSLGATRPQKDVGVQLNLKFQVSTLYQDAEVQLFKLQVTEAGVSSVVRPDGTDRPITGSLMTPAYFELAGDIVGSLRFSETDSIFSRNIKKGIISLFQVQDQDGKRTEIDVSGECEVRYATPQAGTVERVKTNCKNIEIANDFSTANKAMGVSVYTQSAQTYTLTGGAINTVKGSQRVITYLNLRNTLNGGVTSTQNVKLESTSSGPSQSSTMDDALAVVASELGSEPSLSLLPSEEEIQQCTKGCQTPKDLASKLNQDLLPDQLATVKSASAFVQMLKSFRSSGKKTISQLLSSPDSYYTVSQLIDVATAAQTEAARSAMLDLLEFESEDNLAHPQRFLFAAAYSSHPSTLLISDLLSVLKKPIPSESLRESLLLSLGAIIHTFCQGPEQCGQPVVEEFKSLIMEKLSECKEEPCQLMYLRSLGNAGLTGTLPLITSYLESPNSPMLATTAITALRRIPSRYISNEVKTILKRIFNQNKASYDSSVRVAALEMLLQHKPTLNLIRNALLVAMDQANPEFSTYILRALNDAAKHSPVVREHLNTISFDSKLNNYNVIAQKGKSSVISSYLAKLKELNVTYNLFFENSPSGVMKRSGMFVNLLGKTINQPFIKFGIYADGLESLVGEGAESDDEESDESSTGTEPTAGMSFYFMDVLLTQVEFFRGTSGLMSAVWNAPSELTSALQGNLLLQDHSLLVHLSNGLVVDSKVYGALSMDLSGYVSISLWNRNCESLIRNSGALYLEGNLAVKTKEFDVGLTFTGEAQSNIDYTSNADFYEMPLKLCMQMMRPDLSFLQSVQKYEKIKKMKNYKSKCSTTTKMNGESYLLNESNSRECRVMLNEE